MVVAYDGTDFRGFAAQPNQRRAHGRRGARPARSARCCGTTSSSRARAAPTRACTRGARSCRSPSQPGLDPWRLAAGGQRRCSARRSSCGRASSSTPGSTRGTPRTWRRYRYTIVNRPVPDPFRDRFTWWIPEPLDLRALRLAADPFVGEHDFASFCRKGREGSTTMRTRARVVVGRRRRRRAALRDPRESRSAGRWCARSSARSSRSASASAGRARCSGSSRARPRRGRPARPAARPLPLGRRLLSSVRARRRAVRRCPVGVRRRHRRLEVGGRRLGRPRSRRGRRSASLTRSRTRAGSRVSLSTQTRAFIVGSSRP